MNTQVSYIISASLILLLYFGVIQIINKLPATNSEPLETGCVSCNDAAVPVFSEAAQKGKMLFLANCASCHTIFKNSTGPALIDFEKRGPWGDRQKLYQWIRNPAVFMESDEYTRNLKKAYGSMMTSFPNISNEEIDAICNYIKHAEQPQPSLITSN
jgi:mono/diheme cytochrome c family protein